MSDKGLKQLTPTLLNIAKGRHKMETVQEGKIASESFHFSALASLQMVKIIGDLLLFHSVSSKAPRPGKKGEKNTSCGKITHKSNTRIIKLNTRISW